MEVRGPEIACISKKKVFVLGNGNFMKPWSTDGLSLELYIFYWKVVYNDVTSQEQKLLRNKKILNSFRFIQVNPI